MTAKERFIEIYRANVKREGAEELLSYLCSSDFFDAPASAKYHSSKEGGLAEHSLNVYDCLCGYLTSPHVREDLKLNYSAESIAIVSLLHDLCKIGIYKKGTRNVKDAKGAWTTATIYEYRDDFPYGHGEKSVYLISKYMTLSDEEAFAIRYHMGYSSTEDPRNVATAFEVFPLAFAVSVADSEATYYLEKK